MNLRQRINQCLKDKDFTQTYTLCDQLLVLEPDDHHLKAVKGWCLYQNDDVEGAEQLIENALHCQPSNNDIVTLAFSFYMDIPDYRKLIRMAQRCMAFHLGDRLCWHRLGTAHFYIGEYDSSVFAFRRSLEIEHNPKSSFGLSQPLLCQGDYDEGLKRYEERFNANRSINWIQSEKLPMPVWQGESLLDKSILIWSEQGLGDSIQFSRLLTVLSAQNAIVDLILQPQHAGLYGVLSTVKGINNISVVTNNTISLHRRYDYYCPLMSLMRLMKITPMATMAAGAYMSTPISHRNKWATYKELPRKKVGIVWTTALSDAFLKDNPMHALAKTKKSIPLTLLEPLFQSSMYCFFPLQVSITEDDHQILSQYDNIHDVSKDLSTFSDTAAMIDEMDIVISIDSAVAHLSAAMGKRTINVLACVSDWRWQQNREDTAWYPSMTLYRQVFQGDWSQVVDKLIRLLEVESQSSV
jgi:tetratricopeptide (TPR) repeat protein